MKIIPDSTIDRCCELMVDRFEDQLITNSASVFGLATGRTMIPFYEKLVERAALKNLDFSKCFFFSLDEYVGLNKDDTSTFENYLKKHFFTPIGIRKDQYVLPTIDQESDYDRLILECGGIDLQILGIGSNGHIGFNEPGSESHSETRMVKLAEQTIRDNRASFSEKIPTHAVTMGIASILKAKSIIMLATGLSKASIIKFLINHHDNPDCPATFLKNHPHFTLILDSDAASKINLKI